MSKDNRVENKSDATRLFNRVLLSRPFLTEMKTNNNRNYNGLVNNKVYEDRETRSNFLP